MAIVSVSEAKRLIAQGGCKCDECHVKLANFWKLVFGAVKVFCSEVCFDRFKQREFHA